MKAEIIKLSEEEVEIDGVIYKKQHKSLKRLMEDWCCLINREQKACSNPIANYTQHKKEHIITLDLPNGNTEWTFEVFRWTERTVEYFESKGFNCYPRHDPDDPSTKMTIIVYGEVT